MGHVEFAGRILLAAVFCLAVAGKLGSVRAFAGFARSVRSIPGVSPGLATPAAVAVVAAEATVGGLLVVPAVARVGAVAAAGLLAVFTAGTGWLVHRRSELSCRCFGASGTRFGPRHVIRNALLTVVACVVAVAGPQGGLHPAGAAIAAAAGGLLALLVSRWDDLAALAAPVPTPTAGATATTAGHHHR